MSTRIDVDKAVEMYQSGMSIFDVSIELECAQSTVWLALKNRGLTRVASNKKYANKQRQDAVNRVLNGEPIEMVAKSVGASRPTIKSWVRRKTDDKD